MRHLHWRSWVEQNNALLRTRDLDNVVLFTGDEGSGKSTFAFQVMKRLDPTFDERRSFFTIPQFIQSAREAKPYSAVLADEILVNRRKAMKRETVELLDFLQVCRGLNLHLGLCFPHEEMMDRAVVDYRVRWRFHIPKQGVAVPMNREMRQRRNQFGQLERYATWVEYAPWKFSKNEGQTWERYQARKLAHMREVTDEARGVERSISLDDIMTPDIRERADRALAALGSRLDSQARSRM